MKKLLILIFLFFFGMFPLTACSANKGILLFNTQPITKENALSDNMVFNVGQKVYYLFIAPRRMENKFIRVQVFKMTDNAPWGGNDIVRTKDFRLMKDERYYYTDYFTFGEAGRYVMQIFSIDDLQHPLAVDFFYVK
ncbi:MAG: hypothetical protein MJ237_03105 [bacterium]|nr:hypothetical protein [bacterium]